MADCPKIDVTFLPAAIGLNNVGMMGLGEPATVPTAAAVANAVFNAIGVRLRELPMTPARVLAALAAAEGRCEVKAFRYERPKTLESAVKALAEADSLAQGERPRRARPHEGARRRARRGSSR